MQWRKLFMQYFCKKVAPSKPTTLMFNPRRQPLTAAEVAELKNKIQLSKEQTERDSRVDQKTMQLYFNT